MAPGKIIATVKATTSNVQHLFHYHYYYYLNNRTGTENLEPYELNEQSTEFGRVVKKYLRPQTKLKQKTKK